jgi:hypothetical protein
MVTDASAQRQLQWGKFASVPTDSRDRHRPAPHPRPPASHQDGTGVRERSVHLVGRPATGRS